MKITDNRLMVAGAYHVVSLCVQLMCDLLAIAKLLCCRALLTAKCLVHVSRRSSREQTTVTLMCRQLLDMTRENCNSPWAVLSRYVQGDHLSGKPAHVGEFDSCRGNFTHFIKSPINVTGKKILSVKSCVKLFIVSCMFISIEVF